jgi:hypothetical protein
MFAEHPVEGPFIETHQELRQLLRKASTTRSAKKSNEGFVRIATTILSLEIGLESVLIESEPRL